MIKYLNWLGMYLSAARVVDEHERARRLRAPHQLSSREADATCRASDQHGGIVGSVGFVGMGDDSQLL